jgi:hypothetical protein
MQFKTVFNIDFLLQVDNDHIIESMKNEKQDLINKLNENEKYLELLQQYKVSFTVKI